MTAELRCDKCRSAIPAENWNREGGSRCHICGTRVWAQVFPAVLSEKWGTAGEAVTSDAEAGCFFHPQSKAALACDSCGRFLCKLCDIELGNQHVCPTCLQQGVAPSSATVLDNRRVLYDSIVLGVAMVGPLLFFGPSIITGPLAVILAIWFWKRPRSIVPRTRIRMILGLILGILQVLFWVGIIWAGITARKGGS